jgi:hypothetical protein
LIWFARRLGARFPSGDKVALQSVVLEVKIGSGGLAGSAGGAVGLPKSGWAAVPDPGPGRRSLLLSGVSLSAHAGWRFTEPGYALVNDGGNSVGACSVPPHSDSQGRPRLPLSVQGTWTVLAPRGPAISSLTELSARLLLVVDTAADDEIRGQLLAAAEREAPTLFDAARDKARADAPTTDTDPSRGPGDVGGPGGPEYPPFGQGAPAEWGAARSVGWGPPGASGQPAPGWGSVGSNPPPGAPLNPPRSDGW